MELIGKNHPVIEGKCPKNQNQQNIIWHLFCDYVNKGYLCVSIRK